MARSVWTSRRIADRGEHMTARYDAATFAAYVTACDAWMTEHKEDA